MLNSSYRNIHEEDVNMTITFIIEILIGGSGLFDTNPPPSPSIFPRDIDMADRSARVFH